MSLTGPDRQNLDTVKRLLLSEKARLGQANDNSGEALCVMKNKHTKGSKAIKDSQFKKKKVKQASHVARKDISSVIVQSIKTTKIKVTKSKIILVIRVSIALR